MAVISVFSRNVGVRIEGVMPDIRTRLRHRMANINRLSGGAAFW
jgi:hypothetical protein